MSFKKNLVLGIIKVLDNLSFKLKQGISYNEHINIPYIIVVEYNDYAKKLCLKGEQFLVIKHFKNKSLFDIRNNRYDEIENYSQTLIDYYESKKIPIWFKDVANHYPRTCINPTTIATSPQVL